MVTEAGSYLRLIDSCITQNKAQGPSRSWEKSKEEKKKDAAGAGDASWAPRRAHVSLVSAHPLSSESLAVEQRENILKRVKDFHLKARTRF